MAQWPVAKTKSERCCIDACVQMLSPLPPSPRLPYCRPSNYYVIPSVSLIPSNYMNPFCPRLAISTTFQPLVSSLSISLSTRVSTMA